MPIPDFQSCLLPLLKLCADKKEHTLSEAINVLTPIFKLTEEEKRQTIPSGPQPLFYNRVAWARTYLIKAGVLASPRRAHFQITDRGLSVLAQNLPEIKVSFLKQFPEFAAFHTVKKEKTETETDEETTLATQTPEEIIALAHERWKETLAFDLLRTVKSCSPDFFEKLVVELLVAMGYGGSRQDAGQAIGKSGDEGIDGIIKEDRLGLDVVYVQAKRWENPVSRPEIQKFAGALQGQRARKGIFITTSVFTKDARNYVSNIDSKIVLIDGEQMADLMIKYNVGVSVYQTYELKKIDQDYFTEE